MSKTSNRHFVHQLAVTECFSMKISFRDDALGRCNGACTFKDIAGPDDSQRVAGFQHGSDIFTSRRAINRRLRPGASARRHSVTSKKPSEWRDALYRSVALGMAISLHILLFVLITRPVASEKEGELVWSQSRAALQLRFIALLKPAKSIAQLHLRAPIVTTRPTRTMAVTAASPKKSAVATPVISPPTTIGTNAAMSGAAAAAVPLAPSNTPIPEADGGFADQLRAAQDAHSVGPLPGSDTSRVRGIQLIDPQKQGIGAAMRQAQRLFGITNYHCVDVDTWRSMTPQQLLERHITPSDVDKVDAENQCNRPMGLSF
jgi:hypothetical protein